MMKQVKRAIALLVAASMSFSLTACAIDEEVLEDIAISVGEEIADNMKQEAKKQIDSAVDGVMSDLEDSYNQAMDSVDGTMETGSVTESAPWFGAYSGECDHSTPAKYIEEEIEDVAQETMEDSPDALVPLPTEEETEEIAKPFFDVTIRITCKCGAKEFKNIDYDTFVPLVNPGYSFWRPLIEGVSEYEYYSRKYAIYLGKNPIDLDLESEECVIHYEAVGGYCVPEDQYFTPSKKSPPKITEETPVKPGYHFLGWTDKEGSDLPRFFRGKPAQDEEDVILKDTVLYACWREHTGAKSTPGAHVYKITQKRTVVSIKCNCGMAVTERDISWDEFLRYDGNREYSEKERKKAERIYKCYKAQDIGPVALYLNTVYCEEAKGATDGISKLKILGTALDLVSGLTGTLTEKLHTTKKDTVLAEELFRGISQASGTSSEITKEAVVAVSLYKTGKSFHGMVSADDSLDATIQFLNTLECIASFTSLKSCLSSVFEVVRSGVDLTKKCNEYIKNI